MKIAVFGATGVTGGHVLKQALEAGHDVTAMVRSPLGLSIQHPALKVVVGTFTQAEVIERIVAGQDAIITVLGVRDKGLSTICSDGVRSILHAMKATNTRRLIALSAYGASELKDVSMFIKFVRWAIADKMQDKDRMEALVRASSTDWTLVRPPVLTNGKATGKYRAATVLKLGITSSISRADLAAFILREATRNEFIGKAPIVSN